MQKEEPMEVVFSPVKLFPDAMKSLILMVKLVP